jgi:hypothetical protein
MRNSKMLGAAITAVALMAFVGVTSASATALYNGTTKLGVGSVLDFSAKSGVKAKLTNTAGDQVLAECGAATVIGAISNAGGPGGEVEVNNSGVSFGSCSSPITIDQNGGVKYADIGGTKLTVRAKSEISFTVTWPIIGPCRYTFAAGAHLGVVTTGSVTTGELIWNSIMGKGAGSEFACPETARFTMTQVSTTPDNLRGEGS